MVVPSSNSNHETVRLWGSADEARLCQRIVTTVLETMRKLCLELETRMPGDPFGMLKYQHVQEGVADLKEWGPKLGISGRMLTLLVVAAASHDLGRPRERLDGLDLIRSAATGARRHGFLSAEILSKEGLLSALPAADQEIVLQAVRYHSEKTVELEVGSAAHRVCYALRDLDKFEALENQKFLRPEGIWQQIRLFYAPFKTMTLEARHESCAIKIITQILDKSTSGPDASQWDRENASALRRILNAGVSEAVIADFCKGTQLDTQVVPQSYASYMLWFVAFVFDIRSVPILEHVVKNTNFIAKLQFVKARVPGPQYDAIRCTLNDYLAKRGVLLKIPDLNVVC